MALYLENIWFAFEVEQGKGSCLWIIVKWWKEGYRNYYLLHPWVLEHVLMSLKIGPLRRVYNRYLFYQSWKLNLMYSHFQLFSVALLEIFFTGFSSALVVSPSSWRIWKFTEMLETTKPATTRIKRSHSCRICQFLPKVFL